MSMPRITKRLAIITAGIALAVSASVTPYAERDEVRLDPNKDDLPQSSTYHRRW